jgi:hypothetical protein
MRWRFIDPNNHQEVSERNAMLTKIDDWWQAFLSDHIAIVRSFKRPTDFKLEEWIDRHLHAIHPDLMWEFAHAVESPGHRLVITPESDHHLRPLVRAILERAPAIDKWEFYEYRLSEDLESTLSTVEARAKREAADFKVRISRGKHNRVDLTFSAPSISSTEDRAALDAAFVATETLLGEERLNHWIGVIEVSPIQRATVLSRVFGRVAPEQRHFVGLDRFHDTVISLVGSIKEQLSPSPHCDWVDNATWTLWELTPDEADDYQEQRDLFVARSANKELWEATHSGQLFLSDRYSNCGEMFCYVKTDGSEGIDEQRFGDKAEIEEALDEVLRPAKLGCTIGGGTGLRYSYIDLALTDVDKAIPAIKRRLQAGNVPKRSWIQFFDSDLAAEWVGIYDDTPAPPLTVS